jgi:hypothetical protein
MMGAILANGGINPLSSLAHLWSSEKSAQAIEPAGRTTA